VAAAHSGDGSAHLGRARLGAHTRRGESARRRQYRLRRSKDRKRRELHLRRRNRDSQPRSGPRNAGKSTTRSAYFSHPFSLGPPAGAAVLSTALLGRKYHHLLFRMAGGPPARCTERADDEPVLPGALRSSSREDEV